MLYIHFALLGKHFCFKQKNEDELRKRFNIFTSQLEVCCVIGNFSFRPKMKRGVEYLKKKVLSEGTDGNTGEVKQTGNTGTEIITVTLCTGTRFFKPTRFESKKRDTFPKSTPLFANVLWFIWLIKYQLLCVTSSLWHLFQQQHFKQNAFYVPVSDDRASRYKERQTEATHGQQMSTEAQI